MIIVLKDKRMFHGWEISRDEYWVKLRWIDCSGVHFNIAIPTDKIEEELEDHGPEIRAEQGEVKKDQD